MVELSLDIVCLLDKDVIENIHDISKVIFVSFLSLYDFIHSYETQCSRVLYPTEICSSF